MKFGLDEKVLDKIKDIFIKYPEIKEAVIYGSRAKGNYKNGSDIDISLKGENISLSLISSMESDIDDLLLPYTFDFSIFEKISNEELLEHIERVGVSIYKC